MNDFVIDPEAFFEDSKIKELTIEEEGLLFHLICYYRKNKSLPNLESVKFDTTRVLAGFFKNGKLLEQQWIRKLRSSGSRSKEEDGKESEKKSLIEKYRKEKIIDLSIESTSDSSLKVVKAFWSLFADFRKVGGELKHMKLREARVGDWLVDLDLMMRVDKRSENDIKAVYKFLKDDSADRFWIQTVFSMGGLRKHFDQIMDKACKKPVQEQPKKSQGNLNEMIKKDYGKVF